MVVSKLLSPRARYRRITTVSIDNFKYISCFSFDAVAMVSMLEINLVLYAKKCIRAIEFGIRRLCLCVQHLKRCCLVTVKFSIRMNMQYKIITKQLTE